MPNSSQNQPAGQPAGQSATVVATGGQNGELTLRLSDGSVVVASGQTNAELKVGSSVVASRNSSGSYLALASHASQPLLNRSTYQGKSLHSTSWDVDYGRGRLFNEDVGKPKFPLLLTIRFYPTAVAGPEWGYATGIELFTKSVTSRKYAQDQFSYLEGSTFGSVFKYRYGSFNFAPGVRSPAVETDYASAHADLLANITTFNSPLRTGRSNGSGQIQIYLDGEAGVTEAEFAVGSISNRVLLGAAIAAGTFQPACTATLAFSLYEILAPEYPDKPEILPGQLNITEFPGNDPGSTASYLLVDNRAFVEYVATEDDETAGLGVTTHAPSQEDLDRLRWIPGSTRIVRDIPWLDGQGFQSEKLQFRVSTQERRVTFTSGVAD